jgi:hypothetical protein
MYEFSKLVCHVFLILIVVITCGCCELVTCDLVIVWINKKEQIAMMKHEEGNIHVKGKIICC